MKHIKWYQQQHTTKTLQQRKVVASYIIRNNFDDKKLIIRLEIFLIRLSKVNPRSWGNITAGIPISTSISFST